MLSRAEMRADCRDCESSSLAAAAQRAATTATRAWRRRRRGSLGSVVFVCAADSGLYYSPPLWTHWPLRDNTWKSLNSRSSSMPYVEFMTSLYINAWTILREMHTYIYTPGTRVDYNMYMLRPARVWNAVLLLLFVLVWDCGATVAAAAGDFGIWPTRWGTKTFIADFCGFLWGGFELFVWAFIWDCGVFGEYPVIFAGPA